MTIKSGEKMIEITLVGSIGCKGTSETEKLILEVIEELGIKDRVSFKKVIYTGIESEFNPPIFGSPTVLINGKDIIYERDDLPITTA
ncbi:MAG: hypothetical protein N2440_04525 [Actinobacteria bacterium]|nr:hypothetical protein [Actinomycetota bacterium]